MLETREISTNMSKEEPSLSACLQNLEIEVAKASRRSVGSVERPVVNPFLHRRKSKSLSNLNHLFGPQLKRTIFFKKRNRIKNKILREPVLKFISVKDNSEVLVNKLTDKTKLFGQCSSPQDFRSIVSGCEQLSLNSLSVSQDFSSASFRDVRITADCEQSSTRTANTASSSSTTTTCSLQARMSLTPPCDVTIDELASYFETFVHIPKKMSSMAEMMYI